MNQFVTACVFGVSQSISLLQCCSDINYLVKTHFLFFICRTLCSDFIISVLSFFAFSALVSAFQRFTCKHCLQISGLTLCSVT